MKRLFQWLFVVGLSVLAVGCSSVSGTPKVVSSTPVDGGYKYSQPPEAQNLKYRGKAYRNYLRQVEADNLRHQLWLQTEERRIREIEALQRLREEAKQRGVVLPPASTPPAPTAEPTSYVPPASSTRGSSAPMMSAVPRQYFIDQFGRRCFTDQYGRTFVFVPHGQPPPADAFFAGTR